MASNVLWQPFAAADAPTWGPALPALANGAYSISTAIDNTGALLTDAVLQLVFGSAITAGAGSPSVLLWTLESFDGVNFASPNAASAPPVNLGAGRYAPAGGSSITVLTIRPIVVFPCLFKLLIQNNLGVAFPSTVTAKLYRFGLQDT